jgi:hypothetical protein
MAHGAASKYMKENREDSRVLIRGIRGGHQISALLEIAHGLAKAGFDFLTIGRLQIQRVAGNPIRNVRVGFKVFRPVVPQHSHLDVTLNPILSILYRHQV